MTTQTTTDKLPQDQFNVMIKPMELDLQSYYNVLFEDVISIMNNSPNLTLDELMKEVKGLFDGQD